MPDLVREPPEAAIRAIAWAGMPAPEFESPIITPFVVPTVVAAFWCVCRNPDSWPQAVAAAIRLGGDVDTLGAIVGALAGARLGVASIPSHLCESVQRARLLKELALRYHEWVNRRSEP